jgi:ketosteroid isomerase-like protein
MTVLASEVLTAQKAESVVTEFFGRYRAHDVDGMTDLCSVNADFSYVPLEIWGKQRVIRGDGKVATIGKPIWAGLITSFPNLTNTVHTISANDDGDVVAEVSIGGTQQLPWAQIAPAGRSYSDPHLFVFHVGGDLLIDSVTGYWDNGSMTCQLGHVEVD